MLKIIIFSLIVYCLAFVVIYKRPILTKPWEWLMNALGLKDSLVCMLCTGFWIGGILSALNMFVIPQMPLTPSLVIFGDFNGWLEYTAGVLMDMFSVASIVYIIDSCAAFFTDNRKVDVTITKQENNSKQILHD